MSKRKRVYISGPLTDKATGQVTEKNVTAFKRAHSYLTKEGYYNSVCPTNVWACRWPWIYRLMERVFGKSLAYKLVLLYDVILMLQCDYIYKIPGWRESRGAQIESCVAFHFNLWVLPTKQRERIDKKLAKTMARWREMEELRIKNLEGSAPPRVN